MDKKKLIPLLLSIPIHKRLCLFVGMSRIGSGTAEAILMGISLADSLCFLDSNRQCLWVTLGGRSVGENVSQGGQIQENKSPVATATGETTATLLKQNWDLIQMCLIRN